ncbi:ribosomal protein S18 acetylase RimI-like enzyme [Rhizobium sp. PP-F2F-G38]|uniref:GNAT family N-acetyltransferase n=1 Tax=Rhizobium sp. PP-CC-3G-465 TaxID=2135648 RepID=UPI000D93252E|nr:ribosomal protein S18 acetylase RimI-like enzyme [Rhizobium sp. PP-WC-1G-195]PYE91456.1 ribosomal protein S18 acetylase RimI-like enzyme [Rhizobium sp. PP-F2F-G38]TCL89667.1 ribosomal protein S18 acetylase RimI-like enzyme [Rhizobium sp. PP-WC-2G-219]TCP73597.1 ribosomal protein S18 acetylase RimI-like enzyme [Rhizobium sp. PP-CC-2G-626]TCQ12838.1 ribosomal protein S18 acetylase RimI-like enzyme [Rhizobium sp. PP-CC-3G-465]
MHHYFRPITPDDSADLEKLWRTSWTLTYGLSLGPDALSKMLKDLDDNGVASMLPGTGERGYCMVRKDEISGTAVIIERGDTAYLWGMYVHPQQQRKGLGSLLLKGVAKAITDAQKVEIRVLGSSPQALAFYQKHGFVESGREAVDLLGTLTAEAIVMSAYVENLRTRFA